jgi:hypothetical protein
MQIRWTLAIAVVAVLALSACSGSLTTPGHTAPAKPPPAAAKAAPYDRFEVQVSDGTRSSPQATYFVEERLMILLPTRPTKTRALALASDYARKSFRFVRRVTCSPIRSGWRCEYFR